MLNCLVVGAGGFLGSIARYLMGLIPVPTMGINIIGSFLIGLISAYALRDTQFDPRLLLFLRVGICGGFTTFSTFSLDAVDMLRTGSYLPAILYMVLSVVLCVFATVGGQMLVRLY
ncbi:MAG: fluoride efflux transporter CrcB [Eubacteriales bacterium]|nr:fluoride efflux transporter CrcB [Eubacteriales bacterium]